MPVGSGPAGYDRDHWPAAAAPGGPAFQVQVHRDSETDRHSEFSGYQRIQLNEGGPPAGRCGGTARILPAALRVRVDPGRRRSWLPGGPGTRTPTRSRTPSQTPSRARARARPRHRRIRCTGGFGAAWGAGAGYDCSDFDPGKLTILPCIVVYCYYIVQVC